MADSQSSHHKPDLRWDTITPTIITTVLATAVVILRLIVRCKFVKAVGFDDFVIVVSLFLSWVVLGLTVAMVVTGFGSYAWHSPLDLHSATAKLFLSWNVLYVVLIHVTKASILTQYLRIFPTRTMRRLTWLLFAALVPSLLWGVFGSIFICDPVRKIWHPIEPVVRLVVVHNAYVRHDFTASSAEAVTWSMVEANVGIICASLLALKPLIVHLFPKSTKERQPPRWSLTLNTVSTVEPPEHDIEKAEVDQTDGTTSRSASSADRLEKITEELEDFDELTFVGTREGIMNTEMRNHRTKSWSEQTILDMEGVITKPKVAVTSPLTAHMLEDDRELREEQKTVLDLLKCRSCINATIPVAIMMFVVANEGGSAKGAEARVVRKFQHDAQNLITNRGLECGGGRKLTGREQQQRQDDKSQAQPHTAPSTMLLPRIRALPTGSSSAIATVETALLALRLSPAVTNTSIAVRHASHKAQGAANSAKDGAGKRLGAKKSGEQYVIPGNIIFRQRGTKWFPGDNVGMGRDHTIYATQPGYVKYYKDPLKHPKRQYIGVVFERNQVLPQPPHAVRRRRLGMLAHQMENSSTPAVEFTRDLSAGNEAAISGDADISTSTPLATPKEQKAKIVVKDKRTGEVVRATPTLRPGYQYRAANWEIGRAAERAGVKVTPFKPGNRFLAWRKSNVRKAKNAERRGLTRRR
ncbi:ribosomal protein L27 [Aureobasidium subglaciale]|nr:ribosomal protein L27 [Aureobasidium subglaciale]KAI5230386.1 ribosomal protein L27 [Aureobasidium subglaciale]KAI5233616.1 ribosomal protein L27 [Aureobasidium subglaciale]KAI5266868.1 ribosomal protein L27 [Aureobasidium subglaciale]